MNALSQRHKKVTKIILGLIKLVQNSYSIIIHFWLFIANIYSNDYSTDVGKQQGLKIKTKQDSN